jgi:hypothetical protein
MYANFYGRSKHSEVGIFNDENVEVLISSRYLKMIILQESKWERSDIFLMLYVDDISFIGNYVFLLILLRFSLKFYFW